MQVVAALLFLWLFLVWGLKFLRDVWSYPDFAIPVDSFATLVFAAMIPILGLANKIKLPFLGRTGGLLTYSKFAADVSSRVKVPTQTGMLSLYAPSAVWGLFIAVFGTYIDEARGRLVGLLVAVHFGKRCYECLFVHKYSGHMPIQSVITIGGYYFIESVAICYYSSRVAPALLSTRMLVVGLAMFAGGLAGNYYHHDLLAKLRGKDGDTEYKVPRGGWFEYVAAPHYFYELLGWCGLAFVSQHFIALLIYWGMCSYLLERAMAQTAWNRKNIKNYPWERKHLIPKIL